MNFLEKSATLSTLETKESVMAKTENKTEKQAEMLRHNLILRKKQIDERNKIAAGKKKDSDGKELAPTGKAD